MMPVAIDCRIDDPSEPPKYALRMTWAHNIKDFRWKYAIGDAANMRVYEAEAARDKLKLWQRKKVSDPKSGRVLFCAIWRSSAEG